MIDPAPFGWSGKSRLAHRNYFSVRVGPYDDTVMPAATLFWDGEKNCTFSPSFLFYNPDEPNPGQYDQIDTEKRNWRAVKSIDAVMLRPGYKIYLYEKKHWQGDYDVIEGAYQPEGVEEKRLLC